MDSATIQQTAGLITIPSNHSVDDTVVRITELLATKKIKLFALINHSGEAALIGLTMPPTRLLIFGSPQAGTPLMLAAPRIAIDLPLKLLIAEDAAGKVTLTYNSPDYLGARHHLPSELLTILAAVGTIAARVAE